MEVYIGVDCGATNIRIGVVEKDGRLVASSKAHSPLKSKPEKFAQLIKRELCKLAVDIGKDWEVRGLGIATPGPVNPLKGLIYPSANLGNSKPIDLKSQLTEVFNLPCCFDRDTNSALMGEAWQGAAVGKKDVVMLTVGSGIGGAIMANGEIERGVSGKAGEIGHTIINLKFNPPTACLPACLTAVRARQGGQKSKTPLCGLGHEGCLEALVNSASSPEDLGYYLGIGLANIVDIFNPEMIILGGGKALFQPQKGIVVKKAIGIMQEMGTQRAVDEVEVVFAKLGDLAGVYGAAKLVIEVLK